MTGGVAGALGARLAQKDGHQHKKRQAADRRRHEQLPKRRPEGESKAADRRPSDHADVHRRAQHTEGLGTLLFGQQIGRHGVGGSLE